MTVQFIFGRSGTGKTTHCVEAIVEALQTPSEQSLIFLVPEQATYEAERAVLSSGRLRGYHRLRILSFNRLQFFLADKGMAKPSISRIGRQMIVHKILRDNAERLQVFRSSALLPGFARQIAETIRELHRYDKTPEDFETLLADEQERQGSRLSAMKFADIGLVFGKYTELIQGRFVDPDAQVRQACKEIASADFLKGAQLWVDGFASFTGAEIAILAGLLRAVDEAHIALALDPARLGRDAHQSDGLFEPTERTYHELIEQIEAFQIELRKPLLLKIAERFSGCPPLRMSRRTSFVWMQAKRRRANTSGLFRLLICAPRRNSSPGRSAGWCRKKGIAIGTSRSLHPIWAATSTTCGPTSRTTGFRISSTNASLSIDIRWLTW